MRVKKEKTPTIDYGDGWAVPAIIFTCAGCEKEIKISACRIVTEYRCDCGHKTTVRPGAGRQ